MTRTALPFVSLLGPSGLLLLAAGLSIPLLCQVLVLGMGFLYQMEYVYLVGVLACDLGTLVYFWLYSFGLDVKPSSLYGLVGPE